MKKILLFLSFLLISIGALGTKSTLTFTSTCGGSGTADDGSVWTVSSDADESVYDGTKGIHYGTGKKAVSYLRLTTSDISGTITQIVVNASGASGTSAKLNITVGGSTFGSEKSLTSSATNYTLSSSLSGEIIVSITQSCAKSALYCKSIVVTYSDSSPTTYNVSYDANGGTGTMIDDNSPYNSGAAVTVLENTFTRGGYTFTNWNTKDDGTGTEYDEGDTFTINGNTTLYAQWNENTPTPPSPKPVINILAFELLTDINDLHDGDSIIIIDKDNTYALGEQNTNNRMASNGFDIIDNIVEIFDETIQIIRTDTVGNTDNWRLVVGIDSFLYAASSSSNQLKTQTKDDANGQWNISITNNIATIIAQGNNTRNRLEYNSSSTLFACYGVSDQTPVKIYKKLSCNEYYIVLFKNDGINYDTIYVPTCVKKLSSLPIQPTHNLRCNESAVFVGWSEYEVSLSNTKPSGLFQTIMQAPTINIDKTFYAVYANEQIEQARNGSFILTIGANDFNGGSYVNNEGYKTNIAVSTDNRYPDDTIHVKWFSHNVRKSGGMQWRQTSGEGGAGYIYNSTDLNNIINVSLYDNTETFTKYYGTTEHPTSSTDVGTNKGYFCIKNGNSTGSTSKITINFTKNIIPKTYSNYTTYCVNTLNNEGNWNENSNWIYGVPQFNEAAILLKPTTIDIPHATAKYVILDQSSSNTGKLTIQPNKGLEVQDTVSVYDGISYSSTTPNDLILESSSEGNASLIFNNNNNSQATVQLYSKATYPENRTANWQYIGTTMASLNALYNYYGSWIYRWDIDEGWLSVQNGGMMEAWAGYCITQREAALHETSGTLVPTDTENKTITIKSPHTVFANSWTAPIHIGKFAPEDFNITDKTIYFFNTGLDSLGEGGYGNAPGTYVSVPINAAIFLDKDSLIPSQQGVFVKSSTDGSITLRYKDLVRPDVGKSIIAGPLHSPKRTMSNDKPHVLKIYAYGSQFKDRLVILEKEDFYTEFDNGWDGGKMTFSEISPSIYVINSDGSYDEVSAIPDYEGTVLGFRSGNDSICTLKFDYNGTDNWYLNDILEQQSVLISNDNTYTLTQLSSENEARFIISQTPLNSGVSTGISNNVETNAHKKIIINNNVYIINNGQMYNILGNPIK